MIQTHLFEGDLGRVENVGAVSLVLVVLLVPENEGDVGGGAVGCLVAFPGEGDLGARPPAFLHHHVQHLLFCPQAAAVGVEATARDLNVLGAAVHHLVQGHQQLVHHLFALQPPLAPAQTAILAWDPAHVAEGEPPERVEEVVLGVKVKEVKLVWAVEEGREGGVGIALEIIAENFALVGQWHSAFKACKDKEDQLYEKIRLRNTWFPGNSSAPILNNWSFTAIWPVYHIFKVFLDHMSVITSLMMF